MININKIEVTSKEQNILSILDCIIDLGEVSAIDVAKSTGLSGSTVSRVINILKKKELISAHGKEVTELGRRPELIRFNKDFGQIIYMDISNKSINGYISDLDGKVLGKTEFLFLEEITIDNCLDALSKVFVNLIEKIKTKKDKILALGISVPGVVNQVTNTIQKIPNINNFNEVNLVDDVHNIFNIPIIVNNNARLCAVGQRIEKYRNFKNIVYINFSYYGIGAGVVLNGRLYAGSNNEAGEIGEMFFDRDNFTQYKINDTGCLEAYSGLEAMFVKINERLNRGQAKILKDIMANENIETLDLTIVERAVHLQDEDVMEIYEDTIKVWSMAIINIFTLLDPDIVILGGLVDQRNVTTLNKIKHFVGSAIKLKKDSIQLDALGEKAQMIGGTYILKHYVFNEAIASEAIIQS